MLIDVQQEHSYESGMKLYNLILYVVPSVLLTSINDPLVVIYASYEQIAHGLYFMCDGVVVSDLSWSTWMQMSIENRISDVGILKNFYRSIYTAYNSFNFVLIHRRQYIMMGSLQF